jgi:Conjugative transposon protein TcpC
MVRRSTVDRSPQPTVYNAGGDAGTGDLAQGSGGTREYAAPGWRGAGGRWLVWTFRVVVWLVLLVIGYRGVMAIVLNETPPGHARPAPAPTAPSFPVALAGAYALQFGQVYLNFSPATANQRAAQLAQFLPAGTTNQQLGWDGNGSLTLQSEQVAGVKVQDAHHAVVTLLARVNGGLMELGVPVYASAGALVVPGEPAWLPAPKAAVPPSPPAVNPDTGNQAVVTKLLPGFFTSYASGDQATLGRYLEPGVSMTGLGGSVTYGSLTAVAVPPGGSVRHIVATVLWQIPGQPAAGGRAAKPSAGLEMTYALTMVRQHGTWYVRSIAPSVQPGGQS